MIWENIILFPEKTAIAISKVQATYLSIANMRAFSAAHSGDTPLDAERRQALIDTLKTAEKTAYELADALKAELEGKYVFPY